MWSADIKFFEGIYPYQHKDLLVTNLPDSNMESEGEELCFSHPLENFMDTPAQCLLNGVNLHITPQEMSPRLHIQFKNLFHSLLLLSHITQQGHPHPLPPSPHQSLTTLLAMLHLRTLTMSLWTQIQAQMTTMTLFLLLNPLDPKSSPQG